MKPLVFIHVLSFLMAWLMLGGNPMGAVQTDAEKNAGLQDKLYKEAVELTNKGEYKQALTKCESSLKIAEALGDKKASANSLLGIGNVKLIQGDYRMALEKFDSARRLAEGIHDRGLLAQTIALIAGVHEAQGRFKEAKDHYEKALELGEKGNDKKAMGWALMGLGTVYARQTQYPQALASYRRALKINEEIVNKVGIADMYTLIGNLYVRQGSYVQAVDSYHRALEMMADLGRKKGMAELALNLGIVYRLQGLYGTAIEHYQQALARMKELGYQKGIASALSNLGVTYADQGLFDQALEYYKKALQMREALGDKRGIAETMLNLGVSHVRHGSYGRAREYYQKALEMGQEMRAKEVIVRALLNLGLMGLRQQANSPAVETLQQALALGEEIKVPDLTWRVRGGLAAGYEKLGQPDQALKYRQQAIDEIEKDRAQTISDAAKAAFLQNKIEVYHRHIDLLLALHTEEPTKGYDAEAFHYAERARARTFLDLMAEAKVNVEQDLDVALRDRRRQIHTRIAQIQSQLIKKYSEQSPDREKITALEAALAKVDEEEQSLRQEIRRRHPRFAHLQYPEPIRLEQAQSLLNEQTLLLEYVLGEEASFLFAVSKADYRVARLPAARVLAGRVQKLRAALARPTQSTLATYITQARGLYQELIQPAGRLLAGKQSLIIVADGLLHYLPFEVLLKKGEPGTTIDPRRLSYLVNDYAISYVPSASVLAGLRENQEAAPRPPKMFLAYADPVYAEPEQTSPSQLVLRSAFGEGRPWKLPPLPHSRREVERIAQLYPTEQVALFLGEQAREENVKAEGLLSQYRTIHFAVHGLLNEKKPQFSGLVLSLPPGPRENKEGPGNGIVGVAERAKADPSLSASAAPPQREDGLLQIYEIFNLKLRADLVVLSACETGLGPEVKGEGLIGLTRAFLYAGTSSVVVSLWKVADHSTAELMSRFYRRMKDSEQSKAEALRQAQRELIRGGRFAHPYYWAPFVLVGKP